MQVTNTSLFEKMLDRLTTKRTDDISEMPEDPNVDFLKKRYKFEKKKVIHIYEDFEEFKDNPEDPTKESENRKKFNEILKRFLEAVFAQFSCTHPCVASVKHWTLCSSDSGDEGKEIYLPAFSIIRNYYKTNLYDYMAKWATDASFEPTAASSILVGLASAFKHIINQGYSYSNLSPKNIFLVSKKNGDVHYMHPYVGDLGLVEHRDFDDPNSLRPSELSETNDPNIIKFLVSLYFLFQEPKSKNGAKSIIKDFYKLSATVPEKYIPSDQMDDKDIGNPEEFLHNDNFYKFNGQDNDTVQNLLNDFQTSVLKKAENEFESNGDDNKLDSLENASNSIELVNTNEIANIKTVNKAIYTIQTFKEEKGELESLVKVYLPFLAAVYGSGDLEPTPNLCHAAYFAELANMASSSFLPTSVLTKYPLKTFKNDAERLFYEGQVLEGNAYAYANEEDSKADIDEVLTMAANKYKESAQMGFDKAKTRLALLIIDADSSSETMKKDAFEKLLIPAAKTDPIAMYELGIFYENKKDLNLALKYMENAYLNNHPDSVFELARLHQMYALEKQDSDKITEDIKNEIFEHLKKARKLYEIASRLYDNQEAFQMKTQIGNYLYENGIAV